MDFLRFSVQVVTEILSPWYFVDKTVKFNIRQEHVGDTLEARYTRILYAWRTLIAR